MDETAEVIKVDEAVEVVEVDADVAEEAVESIDAVEVEAAVEAEDAKEAVEADEAEDIHAVIDRLRGELSSLRRELSRRDEVYTRASAEFSEFMRLYPDVQIAEISDSVWEMARGGVPLAAAYAYEEVIRRKREREIAEADKRAREASAGSLSGGGEEFYSPDEVRRMSPEEVRANYKKITESMKKWH